MLFTFAVAVTTIGVRELRENVTTRPSFFANSFWSVCFAVTGSAGVWAGLGLARPLPRTVVVLLIALALGAAFVYGINQGDWDTYSYVILMMLLQVGVVIASLLVVRSCGYRLVRKASPGAAPSD